MTDNPLGVTMVGTTSAENLDAAVCLHHRHATADAATLYGPSGTIEWFHPL